ncbi:PEP-CTERM sorting domain-containing protein [Puniceicoccales bacterium CK1056]|uniref:PEP-CTERM sorting domain-containing protein n=1 Tax=Oceanipulchritudo coccoides TaxID=2706888 RepID=A0A6B2LY61_9BACT|nr:PEP-CTERM sorting domain-containing protein [Oceanipulchritudo coccoides]NDV61006.1 PEP-CTERM sorting domain-containing protein [Oceanipulchritudo coccoides]
MKIKRLTSTLGLAGYLLGFCLLATQSSGAIYTLAASGDILSASDGTTTLADAITANAGTMPSGTTVVIPTGFAATMQGFNGVDSTDTIINVDGSSTLTAIGNNNADRTQTVTINIKDSAQYLLDSDHKVRADLVLNYDSSAASSSAGKLTFQSSTTQSTTINLNSGSLIFGEISLAKAGEFNLNGGDLSFAAINTLTASAPGFIDFNSAAGSVLTFTGASALTDLDVNIGFGMFQIDGVSQTSIASWSRVLDGTTLTLTPTPVPEPSTYALLLGLAAFGFLTFHRRSHRGC